MLKQGSSGMGMGMGWPYPHRGLGFRVDLIIKSIRVLEVPVWACLGHLTQVVSQACCAAA